MERPDKNTRWGMLPAVAVLGGGGVIATFLGFASLALALTPFCVDYICSDGRPNVGAIAIVSAFLITGVLGIAAAIVGIRYMRTGKGAFWTISAIAVGAALFTVILLAAMTR